MSEVMRIMQCEATPRKTKNVEMRGIEPRAFHMQSERSTTELHPRQQRLQLLPIWMQWLIWVNISYS